MAMGISQVSKPTQLPPKLQEATELIASAVVEANDAVTLASAEHERVLMDVRSAQARLEQVTKEANKAKKTLLAVTDGIEKRTTAYKERQVKAEKDVVDAERKAADAEITLNKALNDLNTARLAVKEAETAKTDLEDKLDSINKKISTASTQLSGLLSDIDTKTTDKATLTKEVRELESLKNTLTAEIEELETKKSEAQKNADNELATVIATIKVRRAELVKVEKKVEDFNAYMDIETKTLDAKKRALEREAIDVNDQKRKVASDRSLLSPLS